jgi:insulysin
MEEFLRNNSDIVRLSNDVLCSVKDSKEYKILELENGMEVIIVCDSPSKQSGACMTVETGQIDDYDDKLGIAHFLEHMLFLGSSKYPSSDEYFNFISGNGGSSNAHTDTDSTWYHFNINTDKFEKALDIFAYFFIDPLFDKIFVESEVHAVNSEHQKNVTDDMWRLDQVEKKLLNQNHPYSRFSTGDFSTLLPNNNQSTIDELTEKVKRFFTEKYSSHKMKLYLYHSELDDCFLNKVREIFNLVPRRDIIDRDRTINLYEPLNNQVRELLVEPINDNHELKINWYVQSDNDRTGNKLITDDVSIDIVLYILGHEGDNSLYEFLKDKRYLNGLFSFESSYIDGNAILSVQVNLTDLGYENMDEIVKYIYGFINYIRTNINTNNEYYKRLILEHIIKSKISFKNIKDTSPDYFLQRYAHVANRYNINIKYLLASNILISQNYDEHVNSIKRLLNDMTVENSTIVKSSKRLTLINPLVEQYYSVKYEINVKTSTEYQNDQYIKPFIPNVNNLITEELLRTSLSSQQDRLVKYASNSNVKFSHDIYYDLANKFKEDKVYIKMNLVLTDLIQNKNVNDYISIAFFMNYLNIVHNSELYDLSVGLCNVDMDVSTTKLNIVISTYPNNVLTIMDKVFNWIKNTIITNDPSYLNTLNLIKEQFIRQIQNKRLDPPYVKLKKLISDLFNKNHTYTHEQVLNVLNNFDYTQIIDTVRRILSKGYIQCAMTGNLSEELAQNIAGKVNSFTEFKGLHSIELSNNLNQSSVNIVDNVNTDDKNSACKIVYMLDDVIFGKEDWTTKVCSIAILMPFLNAEFFHYMRTLGKVGYIATAKKTDMNTTGPLHKNGLYFLTQSHKLTTLEICEKTINIVNNDISNRLNSLSDEEFINLKLGLVSALKSPDKNVYQILGEIMNMIKNKLIGEDIIRDYKEQLLNRLVGDNPVDILSSGITKYDIINYFNEKFVNNPLILSVGIQAQ